MKTIYLSGPIDNCSSEQATGWREWLKEHYKEFRFIDPIEVENYLDQPALAIEREKVHILESDIFLCYPWKPSTGTSMEAMYAHLNGKKVVSVAFSDGYLSEWIKHHSHFVAPNFADAMEWVKTEELQ